MWLGRKRWEIAFRFQQTNCSKYGGVSRGTTPDPQQTNCGKYGGVSWGTTPDPLASPLHPNLGVVLKNGLRCIGRCVGQLPTFLFWLSHTSYCNLTRKLLLLCNLQQFAFVFNTFNISATLALCKQEFRYCQDQHSVPNRSNACGIDDQEDVIEICIWSHKKTTGGKY